MVEDWDAADEDLEKLLDFDDVEVRSLPKSCKTLPSTDTEVAGTKSAGEHLPLNSSDPHTTANTEIVHAYAIPTFGVGNDLDADDSSAIASVQRTSVIASRVDKLSAISDFVTSKTSQFDTQLISSGPNRLHNESFRGRSGTVTREEGYVDTQRIQSASDWGKPDVRPTDEGHRNGHAILTADISADVQAHVGISDVAFDLVTERAAVRAADHASEERIFKQSTSIQGRRKRCSSLQVDQGDTDVEIVPDASVGQGLELNGSEKNSERSKGQRTQATVHAQTHGARRLGSQFTETGITAPLHKRLNSSENVGTALENAQLPTLGQLPSQSYSNPSQEDCGAHDKRTVQQEAASRERGSSGLLPYRIPGPAGALQDNFRKSTSNGALRTRGRSLESGSQSDTTDFVEGPWITAVDYLNGGASKHLPKVTISTIKSLSRHLEQIPELVAVIKTVLPNGCGDVSVVLKDLTGTISGCIHRSVLTESKYGHGVVPGAVLILHKVTVFSPNPYAHYLNITTENVHKVFGSEVGNSRPQTRVPMETPNNVEGVRDSVQHIKRQPVTRHDASHVHTDTDNEISVQKLRCGESAKNLPNAILDRKEVTEAIHSQVVDANLGIRGEFTKSLLQVHLPDTQNTRDVYEKAPQEALLAAKAKAAGWDFGEDVELLLNDDLCSFL